MGERGRLKTRNSHTQGNGRGKQQASPMLHLLQALPGPRQAEVASVCLPCPQ